MRRLAVELDQVGNVLRKLQTNANNRVCVDMRDVPHVLS
jgi:hypothetical protein